MLYDVLSLSIRDDIVYIILWDLGPCSATFGYVFGYGMLGFNMGGVVEYNQV